MTQIGKATKLSDLLYYSRMSVVTRSVATDFNCCGFMVATFGFAGRMRSLKEMVY